MKKTYNPGSSLSWEPLDIEELTSIAKKGESCGNFCPYYHQANRITSADIIFMPYNYLLDANIRSNFKFDLNKSIIIIDEAHNVAQSAEQIHSFEISEKQLIVCKVELKAF